MSISIWDVLLIVMVTAMATGVAYLHQPRHKALVLSLPIPFSLAVLAVGQPVDASNMTALIVLLAYTHAVRWLHYRLRVPIVPAIGIAAGGYIGCGITLNRLLPATDAAFWIAAAVTLLVALIVYRMVPHRIEPGHRSPLPPAIKIPIISGVIIFLVIIKQQLGGFMTLFPMVGVVAAYEARHCLWTIARQIPVIMLAMTPMIIVVRLVQPIAGLAPALATGWLVLLLILRPLHRRLHIVPPATGVP